MKIYVGVTDKDWFEYLTWLGPDEVNFWQPSDSRTFRVIELLEAARDKLLENAQKYPIEKARGTSKKYTDL